MLVGGCLLLLISFALLHSVMALEREEVHRAILCRSLEEGDQGGQRKAGRAASQVQGPGGGASGLSSMSQSPVLRRARGCENVSMHVHACMAEGEASGAWGWGQEVEVSLYINFKLLHGTTSRRNSL